MIDYISQSNSWFNVLESRAIQRTKKKILTEVCCRKIQQSYTNYPKLSLQRTSKSHRITQKNFSVHLTFFIRFWWWRFSTFADAKCAYNALYNLCLTLHTLTEKTRRTHKKRTVQWWRTHERSLSLPLKIHENYILTSKLRWCRPLWKFWRF